jgi:hypothetical protein
LHPELIDFLDASCEEPFEKRPIVKVWGEKVQEGIVVASALQINGAQKIFWPSGFFSKLISGVSSILEIEKKEIKTAEAICRE